MTINLFGDHRRLCDNSKSAMLAAMEIYNKPKFDYREECCVILFINAWELILKALLSKNGAAIYYPKKPNEDHRTFSLMDSIRKAEPWFPATVDFDGVKSNLHHLVTYRNKAMHFYNFEGFDLVFYSLAQACIKNYIDLLAQSFNIDLADEVNLVLLPLSLGRLPIDPIQFIDEKRDAVGSPEEVSRFLHSIRSAATAIEARGSDVSRLLVTLSIRFESVKSIRDADAVVGIDNEAPDAVAIRKFDPNDFLRQCDLLDKLPQTIDGAPMNQYTFQAFVWKHGIKQKDHLYWSDKSGAVTRYSPELIAMLRNSKSTELEKARAEYSEYLRRKRNK